MYNIDLLSGELSSIFNNNEYLERLTRTGPKRLHVLYKYTFVKIQCIQHEVWSMFPVYVHKVFKRLSIVADTLLCGKLFQGFLILLGKSEMCVRRL